MTTERQRIQQRVCGIAAPVVEDLGLELVDVEYSRRQGSQILRIFLEGEGGVSVDQLQEASRALERSLEVEDVLTGQYRLEECGSQSPTVGSDRWASLRSRTRLSNKRC